MWRLGVKANSVTEQLRIRRLSSMVVSGEVPSTCPTAVAISPPLVYFSYAFLSLQSGHFGVDKNFSRFYSDERLFVTILTSQFAWRTQKTLRQTLPRSCLLLA